MTDHLEELQRKCLKHARKPLAKSIEEAKPAESETAEKGEKAKKDGDEDMDEADVVAKEDEKEKEREKEKEKEKNVKKEGGQRSNDRRDWKQNGEPIAPLVFGQTIF